MRMDSTQDGGSGDELGRDQVYALLAEQRRRAVLAHLAANGHSASVGEIATGLAGNADIGLMRERDARIRLRHTDLPKLADAGVIGVSDEQVRLTATGNRLDSIRERTEAILEDELDE